MNEPIVTHDTACSVKISWDPPSRTGGHAITGYEIRVRTTSMRGGRAVTNPPFEPIDPNKCGKDARKTSCIIELVDLIKSPFYLSDKEIIIAKVNAVNDMGAGELSEGSSVTGPKVKTAPPKMSEPTYQFIKNVEGLITDIQVKWSELDDTGGTPIIKYILYSNGGVSSAPVNRLEPLPYPTATSKNIPVAGHRIQYELRVAAENSCGIGDFSDSVKATEGPGQMQPVDSSLRICPEEDSCCIKFDWIPPEHREYVNIKYYKIQVKDTNGTFKDVEQSKCGGDEK